MSLIINVLCVAYCNIVLQKHDTQNQDNGHASCLFVFTPYLQCFNFVLIFVLISVIVIHS